LGKIPQLVSNTKPAQLLRCAVAEATVAHELSENVFIDFYSPDAVKPPPESKRPIPILDWLSEMDPLRASICRSQIAIVCYEYENTRQKIISQATQRVLATLDPWIFDNRRELTNELTQLFTESLELWQPLQRARTAHFMVDNSGAWLNEDSWEDYNEASLSSSPHRNDQQITGHIPLAILFPRITAGSVMVYHGYALYSTQAAVIAATLEYSQASPSIGLRRRPTSHRIKDTLSSPTERRLSSSTHDTVQKPSSDGRGEGSNSRAGPHRADHTASVSSTRSKRGSAVE